MPTRRRGGQQTPASTDDAPMDEPEVAALTPAQRERLLSAFDTAGRPESSVSVSQSGSRSRKRQKIGVVESPLPARGEAGGFVMDEDSDLGGGGFLPPDDPAGGDGVGGGFLVDEDMDAGGGGFFPEGGDDGEAGGFLPSEPPASAVPFVASDGTPATPAARTHLPLSLISTALRIAGLPPSDPEVLDFFRQSAEGWAGEDGGDDDAEDDQERRGVSRKDWMSVCAVLLASREDGDESAPSAAAGDSSDLSEPDDDDQDEYQEDGVDPELDLANPDRRRTRRSTQASAQPSPAPSLPSDGFTDDDDDDSEPATSRRAQGKARIGKRSKHSRAAILADGERPELSKAEKRAAREAFALFFPPGAAGTEHAVDDKILTVAMVSAVVRDLKEKSVSQDLVKDMVRLYSSTTGRQGLTLSDFESLMWEGNMFHLLSG